MNKKMNPVGGFRMLIHKASCLLLMAIALPPSTIVAQETVLVTINNHPAQPKISKNIYGHFSEDLGRCIYDGFWVDSSMAVPKKNRIRLDVVEALKKIKVPVLRWPGGCFADQYHWSDGIGPQRAHPDGKYDLGYGHG